VKYICISFLLLGLMFTSIAQAGTPPVYRAHQDNSGLGKSEWYVSKGKNGHRLYYSSERAAKKAAKKLRKIDQNDSQVYDDGSGLCDQPGVQC